LQCYPDCIQNLGDFDGHKLQSLTKEGLKFGDEDEDMLKKRLKAYRQEFKPLTKFMKDLFAGKVAKVTVSQRVENSPSVIVTSQYGHSANMERIVRAQTLANPEAYKMMMASKTLELNPRHPIIAKLNQLVKDEPDSEETKDLATIVFDTALLSSGFQHDDADDFAKRINRVLAGNLKIESMDLLPELEVEEDEEEEEGEEAPAASMHADDSAGHDEF
jgi:heat shock protein 90kDa beta